jgi:ABC-type multidrug transport system ATPase subunit
MASLFNISATDLGKKFGTEWIFKGFSQAFEQGKIYVFVGNNGSGKSTLLKTLVGVMPPTKGKVQYTNGKMLLPIDYWFRHTSYAAPYMELVEEFSLQESIAFHQKFKDLSISPEELIAELNFTKTALAKPLKFFSSGMKQKLKLALAIYSTNKALFLDEPTANFDKTNLLWYQEKLQAIYQKQLQNPNDKSNKIIFLASNLPEEYEFLPCEIFEIKNYKT